MLFSAGLEAGEPPLHERIDALLRQGDSTPVAKQTNDAEFLRRVMLDFAGRIPTTKELEQFLTDPSPDKRTQKIEALLAAPRYAVRMRDQMHVMLMERRGEHDEWLSYLEVAFRENRPWDQIVREILDPDAESESRRGAAFFWTKRLEKYGQNPVDYPGLTRDIGRLFLGVDLQCAQCHDHLFVEDYRQADYQGLAAFTGHTFIRRDVKFPAVGEKVLEAPIEFTSVFTGESRTTAPRLPGREPVPIPMLSKDEQFEVPPDKKTRFPGRPKFRPLAILAEQVTDRTNQAFVRNSVNRFWFLMFGRGLVMPLDLHHSGNQATHPELLELLAKEFVAHDFDIRWFLRELALTQAYQRSTRREETSAWGPPESYAVAWERPLSAEQLLASLVIVTEQTELIDAVLGNDRADTPADGPSDDPVRKAYAEHLKMFRAAFANIPRDPEIDFRPSVRAALFLMNDETVVQWFEPKPGGTISRLAKLDDTQLVDELYRTALSRRPSEEEVQRVRRMLESSGLDRQRLVGHLLWALTASAEFALNH